MDYHDPELRAARVTLGAHWLDENHPDWYTRVDTNTLQMSSHRTCILGQTLGEDGYDELLQEKGAHWLQDHSFLFAGHDEWIIQIEKRRAEDGIMLQGIS